LLPTGYVGDLLHILLTTSAGRTTTTVEQHTVPHFRARGSFRPLAHSSSSSSAFFPPTTTCHKQPLAYSSLLPTTTAGLLCAAKRCQQQQHYCWINKDRQLATYRINNFVNARAALSFSSTMTVEQHTVPHFRARGSFRPLARSSCSIFCLLPTDHHLPQAATGLFLFPTNDYCWPPLRREAVPTTTLLLAKD